MLFRSTGEGDTELFTETRKITLVELSDDERLEIEWYGNDHAWKITRVAYRSNFEDLENSQEINIGEGEPLWSYADFIINVAG